MKIIRLHLKEVNMRKRKLNKQIEEIFTIVFQMIKMSH